MPVKTLLHLLFCTLAFICALPAAAQEPVYSTSFSGPLGLNTVPNARMDPVGTIRAGVSTLDPYVHTILGFQLAGPLSVTARQSAEVSDINEDANRLYPGIDLKLRVLKENRYRPEVALGLQSAIGHKRMAGEYLVLSKRYKDFDFSAGAAWGRLGSAAHIDNPLKTLNSHFGRKRPADGEKPNGPEDWFTGEQIGFFGGIEYFTPLSGLSVKADWGADRYLAERAAFDFDAPVPWSLGVNYQPRAWVDMGLALVGGDKLMGRLTLQSPIRTLPGFPDKSEEPAPLKTKRPETASLSQVILSAGKENIILSGLKTNGATLWAQMESDPHKPLPLQIGRASRHIANNAGKDIEEILITPSFHTLRGPAVRLIRSDLESALRDHNGSPQEIWRNASLNAKPPDELKAQKGILGLNSRDERRITFSFLLDNQLSLAEEDSGTLYRTSLKANITHPEFFGLLTGGIGLRINAFDNLHRLRDIRPRAPLPVRSDISDFSDRTVALDHFYESWLHSFNPDLHMAVAGGWLEEMYGGLGGEILYRPYGKTYALGAELWQAFKRDPFTSLALGFNGDHVLTGHLKAWYEIPGTAMTAQASLGRYLAEDVGGTLSLAHDFENGVRLESFITVTDQSDFDLFGGTTHAHHGLRLSMPLGSITAQSPPLETRLTLSPFGRDIGQKLESPVPLYEMTEKFSHRHMARYWPEILN